MGWIAIPASMYFHIRTLSLDFKNILVPTISTVCEFKVDCKRLSLMEHPQLRCRLGQLQGKARLRIKAEVGMRWLIAQSCRKILCPSYREHFIPHANPAKLPMKLAKNPSLRRLFFKSALQPRYQQRRWARVQDVRHNDVRFLATQSTQNRVFEKYREKLGRKAKEYAAQV